MVRVVLIGLALLLAAAAGWMVKIYLSNQRAQLAEMAAAQKPKPVTTSEVLVVKAPVGITGTLSSSDLHWEAWPDDGIDSHYITRKARPDAIDKLAGSAARQPLFAGEPVTEDKLILRLNGGFLAAVLPEGDRAISLKVDEASGIAGLLLPGDRVDVILTHDMPVKEGEGPNGTPTMTKGFVSETIVRDLAVLAVDQDLKHDDKGSAKVGKTVTMAVTEAQAEAIALGRVMGSLTLSLRSAFGGAAPDQRAQPYTSGSDISGAIRARAVAAPPRPAPAAIVAPPPYTVTVFHGLTPETVTLGR